jgi:hypothetical protein
LRGALLFGNCAGQIQLASGGRTRSELKTANLKI